MHHSDFIACFAAAISVKNYLELGVYEGETLSKVSKISDYGIGVDLIDLRKDKSTNIFVGSTLDFFASELTHRFDLIFIDADHNFESVKRDLKLALEHLTESGYVLLHDTDPISEEYTQPGYCSDSFKIIEYLRINNSELDIITLPIMEAGLTIITRRGFNRTDKWREKND